MKHKKAALEMSIGTIIVIVISMTMLILGIVLVRNIMCGAVGLTGEINTKVKGEIDKLFQSSAGEVVCIGEGEELVSLIPGKFNTIHCAINAPKQAEYEIKVKSMKGNILTDKELESWISGPNSFKKNIAPNDKNAQKFLRLNIPDNAPRDLITIDLEIYRDKSLIASPTLDFEVKNLGFLTATIC